MANVTDPLARAIHSTDPQNLIEYITRQKIYDSLYWKEECFGLSARDVTGKAAELRALGGCYGGNNKPTRFLCLALKLLQIQPEEGIAEELVQNEDFKYVRALGAFYMRLTSTPAEIYQLLEPLFNDFRKLRFRDPTGWRITHMDEFADDLLTSDRYCGIALPHLPKRDVLVSAGYLDGPRRSALMPLIEEQAAGDAEVFLQKMADEGNEFANAAVNERKRRRKEEEEKEEKERQIFEEREANFEREHSRCTDQTDGFRRNNRLESDKYYRGRENSHRHGESSGDPVEGHYGRSREPQRDGYSDNERDEKHRNKHRGKDENRKEKKSSKGEKKYGTLFKKSSKTTKRDGGRTEKKELAMAGNDPSVLEGSEEYWNEQRAKLGLKPLKE